MVSRVPSVRPCRFREMECGVATRDWRRGATGGSLIKRGQLAAAWQYCGGSLARDGQCQWLVELLRSIRVLQDLPGEKMEGR
jgi:hypothetical protein